VNWVGASLVMSLGKEADLFLLSLEQYNEQEQTIPDRYGQAFLLFERKKNFFNKKFEL
jgi:hypothetical protein